MKFVGAFMLIMTSSWIGFDMSLNLRKRSKEIRELIHSLQILEAEMGYSQLPLQVIFASIGDKTPKPVNIFYRYLAEMLSHIVTDFHVVWDDGVNELQNHSALKNQELDIMRQFGRNVGHHTFHQQQKHITLTIHHLQSLLDEANDQRLKYERMVKTLGVLIGIFIVVLLF